MSSLSDLKHCMEPHGQGGSGVALGLLMSIPGFAQQGTKIPPVATASGAAGVTDQGQVVCTCGGGVTDLVLGRLVPCVAECGRYFTGTADKAMSFGPWPEEEAEVA